MFDFRQKFGARLVISVWLAMATSGLATLWAYAFDPGPTGQILPAWPTDTELAHSEKKPTLILFAHPHCPCTRASLGELAKIASKADGALDIQVVFVAHEVEAASKWPLWERAASIPGVSVVRDQDGDDARRFGAATSGHAFLHDSLGRLVFQGGITASRGHSGENEGSRAIAAYVTGHELPLTRRTPVYGCPLFDETSP